MDTPETPQGEKKPKRPRISSSTAHADSAPRAQYDRVSYPKREEGTGNDDNAQPRAYQPRPYQQREGGYQPRPYQQREGGYQPRPYQPRQQQGEGGYQPRPYQPRQQREGDGEYQPRPYQQRQQRDGEGGYQQRPYQQRPYQPRQQREGGYQPRQQREGGYQPRQQREGGYQQRQQGGYQQRQQREGGYQPRQQGGYQQRQHGGYQQRRPGQGGFQQRKGGYQQRPQNQGGFAARGKSFTPRPKRIEYEMAIPDPNEKIRLNKFMCNAGICSRREADEFIQQGLVKVNGQVVTELGTKISHSDVVEYDEKVLAMESKCYILLNKPKDCVTTVDDPQGRLTVIDLVKGACNERIYPVGRLDRQTTGVLVLTNDGDLASKLTHPKYVKKKIYHVWTDRDISEEDMQRIADGIELEDGPIHADAISYVTDTDRNQAGIEIHSGRNRIVRRIFEHLGYHITKLDRVYFAGLTKKNLPRGRWRYLTQEEVNLLKMGAFE